MSLVIGDGGVGAADGAGGGGALMVVGFISGGGVLGAVIGLGIIMCFEQSGQGTVMPDPLSSTERVPPHSGH